MAVPAVHVQRHVVTCRVIGPAGASAGTSAVGCGRADDLEAALGSVDGYWVIRRLDVHAAVAAAWSAPQVSLAVSRRIAARVADVVRGGVDPGWALWFPDRAAFVGRFLLDLADGRAAGRWEYAQFADLVAEGAAAPALLAAREPAEVGAALLQLSVDELSAVAAFADVPALLAELSCGEGRAPEPVVAAVAALTRVGRSSAVPGAALVLAVVAARESPVPLSTTAATARDVAEVLTALSVGAPAALLGAVRKGDWTEVARSLTTDACPPLVGWSPRQRAALVDAVAARPVVVVAGERVHTPYGGAFLLLALLDELWSWAAAPLRLLVVSAALGGAGSAASDPLLRLALGVPDDLDPSRRLRQITRDRAIVVGRAAAGLLAELGRRLPGMAAASTPYLRRNALDMDAWVTLDGPGGAAVVELGHAPFAVLLSMTGLDRGSFPGAGERRWTLTTSR